MKIDPGFSAFPGALLSPSGPELIRVWEELEREYADDKNQQFPDYPGDREFRELYLNQYEPEPLTGPALHKPGPVPVRPWAKPKVPEGACAAIIDGEFSSGCGGVP